MKINNGIKKIILLEPYLLLSLIILSSIQYVLFYTNGFLKEFLSVVRLSTIIMLFYTFTIRNYRISIIQKRSIYDKYFKIDIINLILSAWGYLIFNKVCILIFKNNIGTSIIDYNKLEFLFTGILYPIFFAIFIFIKIFSVKEWVKEHKKSICFLFYIFIWLWFGSSYYYISQAVSKNNFIFNEKAKLESVVNGIMKSGQYYLSQESYIRNIIKNEEYKKRTLTIKKGNENINITQNPIGENWGGFYKEKLLAEGYSNFTYTVAPYKFKLTLDYLNSYDDTKEWSVYLNKEYYVINLKLYKLSNNKNTIGYLDDGDRLLENFHKNNRNYQSCTILMEENNFNIYNKILKNHPYKSFDYLIASSNILLGVENMEIDSALESYSYFALEDFLYFSAVTITTLGYGDILPNNTIIRNLVMIEAMLGVIVSGLYVSLLSSKK